MKKRKAIDLEKLIVTQRAFVKARQWEKFHTPKNIAMALNIEASELMELFLWLTDQESENLKKNVKLISKIEEEAADVFYWIIRLVDVLDLDIEQCFNKKMKLNAKKYPVNLSKGKATKYTELKA